MTLFLSPSHIESLLHKCLAFSHIQQLHALLLTSGLFRLSVPLRTGLIDLLALSPIGHLPTALAAFRSLPPPLTTNDWNSALRALAAGPDPADALRLLSQQMLPSAPPRPDALTLSFALRAAARADALFASFQLHSLLLRLGLAADTRLLTTLVDAYAKSSALPLALKVFDEMPVRDIVTWNALISGLAMGPDPREAMRLFERLCSGGGDARERPNGITVIAAASAAAQLGSPHDAVAVHEVASARGLDGDVSVRNALVDMHSKCGSVDRALAVFRATPLAARTLVSWNAVLMALGMHGHGVFALQLFEDEMPSSVRPDAVTYLAVLCACVHSGLVEDGLRIFRSMRVQRNVKHYGAIVDLLGRAGRLQEAHDLITSMPFEPDVVLWQSLLGSCRMHNNIELAEKASEKLRKMGSKGCGDFVLLSNLYASKERWDDVGRVRDNMRDNEVKKIPGFSWTKVDGVVHRFMNGDWEHERRQDIYFKLEEISFRLREAGHVPELSNVLHDIGEEDKEQALYYHSEKLAMAFGLICTPPGTHIHVIKNLRICGDCHSVAKLISKVYDRVITIRDRARYHLFENGICSCGDYW